MTACHEIQPLAQSTLSPAWGARGAQGALLPSHHGSLLRCASPFLHGASSLPSPSRAGEAPRYPQSCMS